MPLPQGHAQTLHTRRSLSRRERWIIGGVLATVAAIVIALVISIGTAGPSSARGCIHATVPGPVGAVQINECGGDAISTCSTVDATGAYAPGAARTIATECRRAGLRVGP
jgi:hypothetical protein